MSKKLESVKRMVLAMQRYPWEQGVVAQAFLECGDEEETICLAREAVHRQIPDGRPSIVGGEHAVTDPVAVGEALLFAARKTGDEIFEDALAKLNEWVTKDAPRSENGIVYHNMGIPEFWVDSYYMLPPYLAAAGMYYEALKQIDGYWEAFLLPEKNLLGHIYNEEEKRFVRRDAWGGGNGWALAGITRVYMSLPDSMAEEKAALVEKLIILLDASMPLMRPDGLFHDVLDDPETFVEANFGQMAAYSIYRGLKGGWLDAEHYLDYAEKIRAAANEKVDRYGMVRDVCGAPHFDKLGESAEGQSFYILMETAAQLYYS
ncbi:MAG: glycoside hydrolase family 88 protein [Oscillospiraceae bacterium]|jgi:rhamnogalacturonyl hydrolase YesR|nr:glycoside hydrolase family 88 protein [Oscillospiraceae bacterium]